MAEGEEYFAVAHIFASFNDTFVVSILCKLVECFGAGPEARSVAMSLMGGPLLFLCQSCEILTFVHVSYPVSTLPISLAEKLCAE